MHIWLKLQYLDWKKMMRTYGIYQLYIIKLVLLIT